MLNIKKLSLVTLLGIALAAPGTAAADHRTDGATWLRLGVVGTHTHDAEDYVNVAPAARLDRLQVRARDGVVALEGIRIEYVSGRSEYADVRRRLRPGEAVVIDLPRGGPIKMLVLDYANRGPHWRARETAHVQVLGLVNDPRFDDRRYRDRYRDPYDRDRTRDRDDRRGYEWRGGVWVNVR